MRIIRNEAAAADIVLRVLVAIAAHRRRLDDTRPGVHFENEGMSFKVLKSDRNVLAEVRVPWVPVTLIIKYPTTKEGKLSKTVEWEARQWVRMIAALTRAQVGVLPALVAFDEGTSILFLEKMRGRTAHRILMMSPLPRAFCPCTRRSPGQFHELGRILAVLHQEVKSEQGSPIWYSLDTKLASVSHTQSSDRLLADGLAMVRQSRDARSQNLVWVHGNLRTDNVFVTDKGVSLIDLENAGAGYPMEDMGRLLAFVLMFRRSSLFPRGFWESIIDHLLRGYRTVAPVMPRELLACVLGEMLYVYGRQREAVALSAVGRYFKAILARSITNLQLLLNGDPEQFLVCPSTIVV